MEESKAVAPVDPMEGVEEVELVPSSTGPPKERTYLLYRYIDGIEEPVGDDRDEVMDVVMHYRSLVSAKLKTGNQPLPMSHFAGTIGSILFHFFPAFPDSELPNCGPNTGNGISSFEYNGSEFRFELEGAKVVATMNVADHLHQFNLCKPYMCPEPTCKNYCAALDEQLFMPPNDTYFVRYAPRHPDSAVQEEKMYGKIDPQNAKVRSKDGTNGSEECTITRHAQLGPGEYLVEQQLQPEIHTHGDYISNEKFWEIMPAPVDSSQLDMHLAQLSTLDSRYVLRFTAEIKHIFDDTTAAAALDHNDDDSESESDHEESYVESALVPGLQQRDFNRVIDTGDALKHLTVDPVEELRLKELLS